MFSGIPVDLSALSTIDGLVQYALSNAVVSGLLLAGVSGIAFASGKSLLEQVKKLVGIYLFPRYMSSEVRHPCAIGPVYSNLCSSNHLRIRSHHVISSTFDTMQLVRNTVYYLKSEGRWLRVILKSREIEAVGDNAVAMVFTLHITGMFMTVHTLGRTLNALGCERFDATTVAMVTDGKYIKKRAVTLDSVALSERNRSVLVRHIRSLIDPRAAERREALGVPNKLTILLSGPPGSGKSSLATVIAHTCLLEARLTAPVVMYKDFVSAVAADGNAFAAIINDIDATNDSNVILCRENNSTEKSNKQPHQLAIGLSDVLAYLDHTTIPKGEWRVLIMTTNHPEIIDPAFLRSGRIDLHLTIDYPGQEEMMRYYTNFRPDDDPSALVQYMIENNVRIPTINPYVTNTRTFKEALTQYLDTSAASLYTPTLVANAAE